MQRKFILLAVVMLGLVCACLGNFQKKGTGEVAEEKTMPTKPLEAGSRFQEVGIGESEESRVTLGARKGGKKKSGKGGKSKKSDDKGGKSKKKKVAPGLHRNAPRKAQRADAKSHRR